MDIKIILPILTLLLGWILNEFNSYFRGKREDKRNIGLMISFLLEIRQGLIATEFIFKKIKSIEQIPPELEIILKDIFKKLIPSPTNFFDKFEESINLISMFNPYLGYQLRNKNKFYDYLDSAKKILPSNFNLVVNNIDNIVSPDFKSQIENIIIQLSWIHGIKTWIRMKSLLNKKSNKNIEFEKYIDEIIGKVQQT